MKTLRIILWDQLNDNLSSLEDCNKKTDFILMSETFEDCTYVKHHKKKLVFILSAMRHFAEHLIKRGFNVIYTQLDAPINSGTLTGEIKRVCHTLSPDKIVVTWPGEYRILHNLNELKSQLDVPLIIRDDTRFLATPYEFSEWASTRKMLRMEFFYREMRKKHQILMSDDKPVGGKWNYDAENRKFPKGKIQIPLHFQNAPDQITKDVIKLITHSFPDHFGDIEPFYLAVTRKDALRALKVFIQDRLASFGDYQDAMIQNEPWMFHSHLSFYLNIGLLDPLECIKAAENAYYEHDLPLASVEGFIRQILGWREYVRGIYWLKMPKYKSMNFLKANHGLPSFFWTAQTKLNCLKQCITETKQNAYAHHIQRLMVIGNFALLAGIHPDHVNEWYLIVYADAFEWVELPNVTGMILFSDGGYLASKPYAASGAYINKMSNYCDQCVYDVKEKNGPNACPFNYLYWNFLIKHQSQLQHNQRLSMIYSALRRLEPAKIKQVESDAKLFLKELASLTY